ncbi:MAG TPA: endolytic transglycosylase MltG, partial [Chloroflexota bacterium]
VPAEQGRIASVFLNRLQQRRPLEADPTVQYALLPFPSAQPAAGFWKRALDQADLSVVSSYNTYRNSGLPPGPICSPGLGAIEAVASPEPGPWLYFVARGDGTHLFATTLDEHINNLVVVGHED